MENFSVIRAGFGVGLFTWNTFLGGALYCKFSLLCVVLCETLLLLSVFDFLIKSDSICGGLRMLLWFHLPGIITSGRFLIMIKLGGSSRVAAWGLWFDVSVCLAESVADFSNLLVLVVVVTVGSVVVVRISVAGLVLTGGRGEVNILNSFSVGKTSPTFGIGVASIIVNLELPAEGKLFLCIFTCCGV